MLRPFLHRLSAIMTLFPKDFKKTSCPYPPGFLLSPDSHLRDPVLPGVQRIAQIGNSSISPKLRNFSRIRKIFIQKALLDRSLCCIVSCRISEFVLCWWLLWWRDGFRSCKVLWERLSLFRKGKLKCVMSCWVTKQEVIRYATAGLKVNRIQGPNFSFLK